VVNVGHAGQMCRVYGIHATNTNQKTASFLQREIAAVPVR
jgi:hypothetical protein